jgi:hypothetical protein
MIRPHQESAQNIDGDFGEGQNRLASNMIIQKRFGFTASLSATNEPKLNYAFAIVH